ncbi:hypothetical protein DYY67_2212 [Candidatus Nitrosotalea sp. TS]|nr:hypothetical protein [Candidatus Nitrosotalea sp. TS]
MIRYKFSKNMRILFVGINPSPGTYKRGYHFQITRPSGIC